jgi:signal peptide peptidase SppA
MKAYPHLFSKLFCQPLMLNEPVRFALESTLLRRMGIAHPNHEEAALKMDAPSTGNSRVDQIYSVVGNVAVVALAGIIDKHISDMDMMCYGGADLADFDAALIMAAENPQVERVVLCINSPGGSVTGVPESAARVAALARQKEVFAFVDCMACSAAYYIASQAGQVSVASSAMVGSIGVYLTLLDATRAAEMEGYKVELITAGKFKAMGSPFKPLSDEERGMFQEQVTALHTGFRAAVRTGRGGAGAPVFDSAMEGQVFYGEKAVENGLADEITPFNLAEFVSALGTGSNQPPTAPAASDQPNQTVKIKAAVTPAANKPATKAAAPPATPVYQAGGGADRRGVPFRSALAAPAPAAPAVIAPPAAQLPAKIAEPPPFVKEFGLHPPGIAHPLRRPASAATMAANIDARIAETGGVGFGRGVPSPSVREKLPFVPVTLREKLAANINSKMEAKPPKAQ